MKADRRPPRCATWLIEHWSDRYQREALVGDLLEEYQGGRSGTWYWRQCAAAVIAGAQSSLSRSLARRSPPSLWRRMSPLLLWWSLLAVFAFTRKESVYVLMALDPTLWWLISHRSRRRRA